LFGGIENRQIDHDDDASRPPGSELDRAT
jgi:hypothetical protein